MDLNKVEIIWSMKIGGILLLWLSMCLTANAQQKAETSISIGANASLFKIQDTGMSPAQYNGIIPGVQFRLERVKPNSISTFNFIGANGVLNAKGRRDGKVSRANQDGFDLYYSYLRKLPTNNESQWEIYGGLQLGTLLRYRLHNKLANSARLYENISYVGPAIKAERQLQIFGMPLSFGARIQVPVFAAVVRPSITNLSNYLGQDDDEFKSRFEEHGFTSFDNLFMVQSEISLKFMLKNSGAIGVNYNWEFIDYTKPNKMQSANHLLGMSYVKILGSWRKKDND